MSAQMSALRAIRVIAAREIWVKARDKAFIGSTVFMLLLVTAGHGDPDRDPAADSRACGSPCRAAGAVEVVQRAAELGRQAQQSGTALPPELAVFGLGGLPAADVTSVEVEPGVDVQPLVARRRRGRRGGR